MPHGTRHGRWPLLVSAHHDAAGVVPRTAPLPSRHSHCDCHCTGSAVQVRDGRLPGFAGARQEQQLRRADPVLLHGCGRPERRHACGRGLSRHHQRLQYGAYTTKVPVSSCALAAAPPSPLHACLRCAVQGADLSLVSVSYINLLTGKRASDGLVPTTPGRPTGVNFYMPVSCTFMTPHRALTCIMPPSAGELYIATLAGNLLTASCYRPQPVDALFLHVLQAPSSSGTSSSTARSPPHPRRRSRHQSFPSWRSSTAARS